MIPQPKDLRTILLEFYRALSLGDSARASEYLHEKALLFVNAPPQVMALTATEYLSMIAANKVGGYPFEVEISDLVEADGIASAHVRFAAPSRCFFDTVTLHRFEQQWVIVSRATFARTV